jgi:ABC-2 type transport system ATP-binding protein
MSNAIVQLQGVTKQYPRTLKPAVSNVSFQIHEGSTFGLLGPNGAGKSSTVMMLCGLSRPDAGTISVAGYDSLKQGALIRQHIGVAPQEIALFPTLTARENLVYFGRMYGLSGSVIRERVGTYLDTFGLTDKVNKRVQTFSGGMKRRLNLIAALLPEPKLIILDEPTAGVDVQSRNMILNFLIDLKTKGVTIIYSSHVLEEAERICTHIGIMDEGNLITQGTLNEVMGPHTDCNNLEELFLKLTGKTIRE